MERVVYVLGAGFSAPLGIPVIANFLSKARDLQDDRKEDFVHFDAVFRRIKRLGYAKNYVKVDLSNIEEILSLLQMEDGVGGKDSSKDFERFVADVVRAYTPDAPVLEPTADLPTELRKDERWQGVLPFVGSLANMDILLHHRGDAIHRRSGPTRGVQYSVVSFNYDDVVERALACLRRLERVEDESADPQLEVIRLHGSVSSGRIIPPTWSKQLSEEQRAEWAKAFDSFRSATHLRFLGYSFPESDVYFRYLVSAALVDNDNLKRCDVVCLDPDGSVERRYRRVFSKQYLRFQNVDLVGYLSRIAGVAARVSMMNGDGVAIGVGGILFREVERGHEQVFPSR